MRPRTRMLLALTVMVIVPLAVLSLLAARLVAREERLVRQTFAELALAQLQDLRQVVTGAIQERERQALAAPEALATDDTDAERLRRFIRAEPLFRAALLLDPEGRILYPPEEADRTSQESAFLQRARAVLRDPATLATAARAASAEEEMAVAQDSKTTRREPKAAAAPPGPPHGWYVWYDGDDLDLLFWQRTPNGRIAAVEVDRARLLADVIARLPDSVSPELSFALLDARGEVLHRWGGYRPPPDANPTARLALDAPLAAWQLVQYAPATALGGVGTGLWSALGLGLAAFALALSGLAVFLHREHSRGIRLAEQRVSFVNRVSHELKTPLTNIRLYAELLQERIDEEDADARRQLDVVVAEAQRLGRLIDNVLTFGRHQRGALQLRHARGRVDDLVKRVAERWRAPLDAKNVRIELHHGAPDEVLLDADAITQILDNLLGNVEKYAAAGGLVSLDTAQQGDRTTITVADRGPGIPKVARERVFLPFQRLGDSVSEGASGTGIGLAVVRELARLHGGDAVVRESVAGASFEVTLETPREPTRGDEA